MSFQKNINSCPRNGLYWGFIQPGAMNRTILKKKKRKRKEILFVCHLNDHHNGKRRDNLFSAETFRQENV